MKHICIWLVRFYQKFISPLKREPCCRFYPTCSAYALEAFQKRGFFIGFCLTCARIFRCNPFFAGGLDPVPKKGFRNPKVSGDLILEDDLLKRRANKFVFVYDLPLLPNKNENKNENENF